MNSLVQEALERLDEQEKVARETMLKNQQTPPPLAVAASDVYRAFAER